MNLGRRKTDHAPKDLPRGELQELAWQALRKYPGAEIHFKFTCEHCGERCTLEDANSLYEFGICAKCGKETKIEKGGFDLLMRL